MPNFCVGKSRDSHTDDRRSDVPHADGDQKTVVGTSREVTPGGQQIELDWG